MKEREVEKPAVRERERENESERSKGVRDEAGTLETKKCQKGKPKYPLLRKVGKRSG